MSSLKITEVEIFEVKVTTQDTTWHPVIVRIHTNEGVSGVGEVALAYGVGSTAGVGMVRNLAEHFLLGADPFQIEYLWDRIYRKTWWGQGGGPVVYGGMSAIDEALWDIKGKALGVPVYELLGGRCWDKLRVYVNGWYDCCATPEEYAEAAQRVVADGYSALKFDPFSYTLEGKWDSPRRALDRERADRAYERVKAVREAVGPEVDILIGFRQYIEEQAVDILQPDAGLAGGITEVKKIAAYAETYNLHVQPHNCAGPVATAAAVQLDACMTNFIIQELFPYQDERILQLAKEPLESKVVDGYLEVPDAPGLGIELNDEVIRQYPCVRVK